MKQVIVFMLISLVVLSSCDRDIPVRPGIENFKVSVVSDTVKAGEEFSFNFEGKVDMITFYSGEVMHEYAYKAGREVKMEQALVSFTTSKPSVSGSQANQFSIHASTDFNGDYSSYSNIEAATWTDITDRFTLATLVAFVPAGKVDLYDLVVEGKPLYIGFKYTLYPMELGKVGTWHVQSFDFQGTSALGPMLLGDMTTSGFRFIEQNPVTGKSESLMTATRITFKGYAQTAENNIQTETWAVSKGFELGTLNLGPDLPVGIKGVENIPMETYEFIYEKPGTYKATFLATNGNVSGSKRVVREVEITVIP